VDAYEKSENINVAFYAGIYALVISTLSVAGGIASAVYQRGAWVAGRRLHAAMTRAVMGAPLSWWKDVPIGRVINRFSQDVRSLYVLSSSPHLIVTALLWASCKRTYRKTDSPSGSPSIGTSPWAAWFSQASTWSVGCSSKLGQ
jgi:hypothetical protein